MPVFRWVGVGPNGETMRGEMEAMTRQAVITRLRTQRINPSPEKIKEKGKGFDREINLPSFGAPVKQHDIVIFTRQFATMIDAGLPLVQCLDILSQQSESKALCKALKEVKEEVEAGSTFAAALKKHPKIFTDLYCNMVAAGEVGGILDTILNRLASYMEKIVRLKSKIKGAMIYPACIIAAAVLVTGILLVYVIPVFAELFNSFGQALPAPTQFVINLSNFTINNFWIIIGAMIAVAGGFVFTSRTERGRYYLDKIGLRVPVFGDLIRKTAIARFARTLGTLVSSGVPILDALTITGRTAGNKIIEEAIFATRTSISEGKTIAEPLIASKVFPPMVCHMIAVGETTGALDQMLQKIADFYEDEVDNAVANLTALMEPMVILLLGGLIGGLVVSMYLPIFKLGSVLPEMSDPAGVEPLPRSSGSKRPVHEQPLRRRLAWFLLVRTVLVSLFLAFAAWVYGPQEAAGPDPRLGLIALGYGVTAISAVLLPRVRHIVLFAGTQVAVDLALVTLVILATGGLTSPLAVLYNVVILNSALLRLGRGILATAGVAALVYGSLMTALAIAAPGTLPLGPHAVTHGTIIVSFFAIAGLARYLTTQLAAAESMLAARQEDLGRIEVLQQLVANAVDNGLVVTDAHGRIISANPTAAEILGLPSGLSGLALDTLLPGATALGADGGPTEMAIGEHDAARHLRVKVGTVTDTFQHAIGRIYVLQDMTIVRELEGRLREQEQLEAYADTLRTSAEQPVTVFEGLVGESEAMRRVFGLVEKVAPSDSTVLVTGESGTGKELVARAIHSRSARTSREFVPVNCGAIPETLIESELFGHVRGAFTGAVSDRPGLFRQAHRGTIFLDEIGELPLSMQVRLLRVLQERVLVPVGGTTAIPVDVRIVAATNRDLERLVAEGKFREDLYYRLNVIRIETPSLRARPEDIPLLLVHLLATCSERHGKHVERVSPRTLRTLCTYTYPGNIRELENIIDHAITLCDGDTLTEHDLPAHLLTHGETAAAEPEPPSPPVFADGCNLDEQLATYEKDMLLAALERSGGVRKRAAELLGIKYRSLRHRLSKYGLASAEDDDLDLGPTLN